MYGHGVSPDAHLGTRLNSPHDKQPLGHTHAWRPHKTQTEACRGRTPAERTHTPHISTDTETHTSPNRPRQTHTPTQTCTHKTHTQPQAWPGLAGLGRLCTARIPAWPQPPPLSLHPGAQSPPAPGMGEGQGGGGTVQAPLGLRERSMRGRQAAEDTERGSWAPPGGHGGRGTRPPQLHVFAGLWVSLGPCVTGGLGL